MAYERYQILDEYTSAEATAIYEESDDRRRIRLLLRLYANGHRPPLEIAERALSHDSPTIRRWIARNGHSFDYSERHYTHGYSQPPEIEHPERDLRHLLRSNADPLVRAGYAENRDSAPQFDFGDDALTVTLFKNATSVERFAMMRNPRLDQSFVELLFDPDDHKLNVDLTERGKLIIAFLSNQKYLETGSDLTREEEYRQRDRFWFVDRVSLYEGWQRHVEHFRTLWKLAARWPDEPAFVRWRVMTNVNVDDETKASYFASIEKDSLRREIVERNVSRADTKTLQLALQDKDDAVREWARRKGATVIPERVSAVRSKVWSALKHFGLGLLYLAKIALAYAVLNLAAERSQIVNCALLVMIFEAAASIERSIRWRAVQQTLQIEDQAERIRKLLGEKLTPEKENERREDMEEIAKAIGKVNIRLMIASSAGVIIILLAIWKLITAVL